MHCVALCLVDSSFLPRAQVEDGWRTVGDADEPGMQITYRKDAQKEIVILRVIAALPHAADAVFALLRDVGRRKEWDCKFHAGKVVEVIDECTDVVHLVFKSFSSPYKYRDFCLLRAHRATEDGGHVMCMRSVVHAAVPEYKDHVRAVLLPTGYILTPCTLETTTPATAASAGASAGSTGSASSASGSASAAGLGLGISSGEPTVREVPACLLSYVAQMDREAVLIVSPDLMGEADDLWCSVRALKHLLDVHAAPELAAALPPPVSRMAKQQQQQQYQQYPAHDSASALAQASGPSAVSAAKPAGAAAAAAAAASSAPPPSARAALPLSAQQLEDAALPLSHRRSYLLASVPALLAELEAEAPHSPSLAPQAAAAQQHAPNQSSSPSKRSAAAPFFGGLRAALQPNETRYAYETKEEYGYF